MKILSFCLLIIVLVSACAPDSVYTPQSVNKEDSLVMTDITWDSAFHARMIELQIPSEGSLMQGLIYEANGPGKHHTLILLHGFPGNEKNLDIAQAVRSHGWNVIYFDYRGSWGSQGAFTFKNCVQDVVNVVKFCKQYSDSLQIDTSNIALFGHSMGGWVCLKALQQLPTVKKGFALSAWDIYRDAITDHWLAGLEAEADKYFVLNKKSGKELFAPLLTDSVGHMLLHDGPALSNKEIVMLDEHNGNKTLADSLKAQNKASFSYDVWKTDHPFSNKRISLIKKVINFLDK